MIYLIGGAPRVGKSTLSKMLLTRKGVPYIPADLVTHAVHDTYPELGLRKDGWDSIPDKFLPLLKNILKGVPYYNTDFTVEGDSFFPSHAKALMGEFEVKCCFLGTSDINLEDIRKHAFYDWVGARPIEEQQKMPARILAQSQMFKEECEKYGVQYFDMAVEREKTLEAAYNFLIA